MSVNRLGYLVILTLCVLLLPGCAKKASEEIDFGTVKNSVYHNDYFGFNLNLPPEWSVQDEAMRQRLAEAGTKMLVGNDSRAKALLKASEQQSVNLLAAFKHPIGTPVTFNPNVICMAERLGGLSGVKTGKDYHFHARRQLQSAQMKIDIADELTQENLGGIDFDVMHGSIRVAGLTVHQKYYAAVMKNYALIFITSYLGADQQSALQNIVHSLAFNQPASGEQVVNARTPSKPK